MILDSIATEKQRRYPGASSFADDELQRLLFYGRQRDSHDLLHLVLAEPLVVVFGQSGVGKSSLINAGLKQELRDRGYFPVVGRVGGAEGLGSPLDALHSSMEASCDDGMKRKRIEAYSFGGQRPDIGTQEALRLPRIRRGREWMRPLLIMDQFEELFSSFSREQRIEFINALGGVVRGKALQGWQGDRMDYGLPNSKVVISIREDFVGHLEELAQSIPGILRARFRVVALQRAQAMEAICGPARVDNDELETRPFSWAEGGGEILESTLDFLCQNASKTAPGRVGQEVEPFQLQLVCQFVEDVVRQRWVNTVTISHAGGRKALEDVLRNYYRDTVALVGRGEQWIWWGRRGRRRRIRRLCEEILLTPTKRRQLAEESTIKKRVRIGRGVLDELVLRRLLRREPRGDTSYYELSHDTLIDPIVEAQSARRRRRWTTLWGMSLIALGVILAYVASIAAPEELQQRLEVSEGLRRMDEAVLSKLGPARTLAFGGSDTGQLVLGTEELGGIAAARWAFEWSDRGGSGKVAISMSSADFDTLLYARLEGGRVVRDDDGGGGTNSRIEGTMRGGTAEVVATSFSGVGVGEYAISVERLTLEVDARLLVDVAGSGIFPCSLESGACEIDIGGGTRIGRLGGWGDERLGRRGFATWELKVPVGWVVSVCVEADEFDAYVAVVVGDGVVAADDDSGDGRNARLDYLGDGRDVKVVVTGARPGAEGWYAMEVVRLDDQCLVPG